MILKNLHAVRMLFLLSFLFYAGILSGQCHNGKIVSMDDPGFNMNPGTTYQAMAVRQDRIQFLALRGDGLQPSVAAAEIGQLVAGCLKLAAHWRFGIVFCPEVQFRLGCDH